MWVKSAVLSCWSVGSAGRGRGLTPSVCWIKCLRQAEIPVYRVEVMQFSIRRAERGLRNEFVARMRRSAKLFCDNIPQKFHVRVCPGGQTSPLGVRFILAEFALSCKRNLSKSHKHMDELNRIQIACWYLRFFWSECCLLHSLDQSLFILMPKRKIICLKLTYLHCLQLS